MEALEGQGSIRSPGTIVTCDYELPCGCKELEAGPLQEQRVLLMSVPSLQSLLFSETRKHLTNSVELS